MATLSSRVSWRAQPKLARRCNADNHSTCARHEAHPLLLFFLRYFFRLDTCRRYFSPFFSLFVFLTLLFVFSTMHIYREHLTGYVLFFTFLLHFFSVYRSSSICPTKRTWPVTYARSYPIPFINTFLSVFYFIITKRIYCRRYRY